jgi:hypothetical protein
MSSPDSRTLNHAQVGIPTRSRRACPYRERRVRRLAARTVRYVESLGAPEYEADQCSSANAPDVISTCRWSQPSLTSVRWSFDPETVQ